MFTFHLSYPPYFEKEAATLAKAVRDLGDDNDYGRDAGEEIVHSFFDIVNKSTCDRFNTLFGAAVAICITAPVHKEECECNTCILRKSVHGLIGDSARMEAKENDLAEGWRKGWAGPGYSFPENQRIKDLQAKEIPKEIERLAAEFAAARERNEL